MLPPSTPDLLALDLLDSIAELGSLGQAATRHALSQPAVSMRMSQLERRLGLTLLMRTPAGTRLTPAGERVVTLSRRVLAEARAMMTGIEALVAAEGSHLRVAASLTVAEHLLPGWLVALHRESPDVILSVEVTNSARVLGRVREGLADVGFVEGHEQQLPGLRAVQVRSDRLVVVVAPGHPWAGRRAPVTGDELAATELIVREVGSGTREILADGLAPFGGIRSRMELGSSAAILAAARRGEGPAVLSALAVAADVEAGRLAAVPTEGVSLARALRAVWPEDRPLAPLASRLLNVAVSLPAAVPAPCPRSPRPPSRRVPPPSAAHKCPLWVPKELRATLPALPAHTVAGMTALHDQAFPGVAPPSGDVRWVKVLDQSRCIGCHACTTACKSENEVPLGVTRTYVKSADVGTFPQVRRAFQVTRCNQCTDAPCVAACPTQAMYKRDDGIVDFDKEICIGCKACMAACPYDAIFINPQDHSAEKCNMCAHRLDVGLEPACVTVCPTEAILVGDLNDPDSKVAQIIERQPVQVRRPEKETRPGVFYKGAHQATLDPLAARRPDGGLFAWATQGSQDPQLVVSGHPDHPTSSAAALLSYDIPHHAPWGWRVSLYTWTKSIAAGAFGVTVVLAFLGYLDWNDSAVRWAAPVLALAFLAVTGVLLIADLKHPARFYLIFTRRHWRSWLVRGSFIIGGYGGVAGLYFLLALAGSTVGREVLAGIGLPLALATAVYTAYLFAQAKARDLWQSPLLPAHLAVQAVLAGAAAMLPLAAWLAPGRGAGAVEVTLALAAGAHLLLVAGETTLPHVTAHAHLATREMTRGRYARFFWPGLAGVAIAVAAPWIGVAAAPFALLGLLGHEHAYVQGGQSVPLA